jgi:hypothetical protein
MTPTKTTTKKTAPDRTAVVRALRALLEPYVGALHETKDGFGGWCLETGYVEKFGTPVFFGGVREGKAYVSYYLMPVYMCPDLLKEMSPELKKHMQGKSCFNFKQLEPTLFAELRTLTERGFARFRKEGYV